ncbi:MAG: DSD1 family PLP-dependent enzyme [Caulobacteraceae bacterium]|nr:DSD1 family PLP-dependent enzyme [Caulobacteraceae bacterium]
MSVLSDDRRLHGHLIGQQGSRRALNTPVLVVDLDVLEANIAAMARKAAAGGARLRPHAKTHKSVDIARRQVAAGAFGLCCAKLGEAEALAAGDIPNLHITSPVVSAPAIARLAALNDRSPGLSVVADHPDNVAALAQAASVERPLTVFVDVDPGIRRTGVANDSDAVALARQIAAAPSLRFGGVQKYCGREQHIEDFAERRAAIVAQTEALSGTIAALRAAGLAPPVVTGGGTGTHEIDLELGVFNELQVGSYVFMDDQYLACRLAAEPGETYGRSLMVEARVVSANHGPLVTVDAGFKAFSTDADPPQVLAGAGEGARFAFMGDEHGAVIAPGVGERLRPGDMVTLAVPHCDPTVNLYESYHVVRGDTLVDIWPVSARGRSR